MPAVRRRSTTAHAGRHVDPVALEVERVELLAELDARQADQAAGLAPVWARRSLFPHELAAQVSFAELADDVDRAGQAIARRLGDDRAAMTLLLDGYVGDAANVTVARIRLNLLLERGILTLPGAGQIVDAAERALAAELSRLAVQGAARVVAEAEAQGVTLTPAAVDPAATATLEATARRLAVAPHVELIQALQIEAGRLGDIGVPELIGRLHVAAAGLASGPLEQAGRNAASSADGLGRQAAADVVPGDRRPARIYASEILDGNTCGPCSLVDGTEYPSLPAARLDYPTGIYRACEGRERCRGTLVFVWQEEVAPTLQIPFGSR